MAEAATTLPSTAERLALQHDVEQFLYRQAEILDDRRWDDWLALFTRDGTYWMPAKPEHTSGEGVPSIFYEDHYMMRTRIKRISHPRAWSFAQPSRTSHVVGNVVVESAEGDAVTVRSKFHVVELRLDEQRYFAGRYRHELVRAGDGFRIKAQRVDLLNYDAPFDYVLQYWL